ncbi:hypothetical protein BaRGS_00018075 [Batillaria attramentaria]|uniref:Uncharacterized protein n=1 Tax=Batillaria attramentaria TaxID=370345 RepID=A0ABD0KTT4_9CAEN
MAMLLEPSTRLEYSPPPCRLPDPSHLSQPGNRCQWFTPTFFRARGQLTSRDTSTVPATYRARERPTYLHKISPPLLSHRG